jgi:DNA polymerase elongation subunit (family B)
VFPFCVVFFGVLMDIGLQTVRRDNCRLVSTVIETCLHKMLIDRDVKGAEEWVHLKL